MKIRVKNTFAEFAEERPDGGKYHGHRRSSSLGCARDFSATDDTESTLERQAAAGAAKQQVGITQETFARVAASLPPGYSLTLRNDNGPECVEDVPLPSAACSRHSNPEQTTVPPKDIEVVTSPAQADLGPLAEAPRPFHDAGGGGAPFMHVAAALPPGGHVTVRNEAAGELPTAWTAPAGGHKEAGVPLATFPSSPCSALPYWIPPPAPSTLPAPPPVWPQWVPPPIAAGISLPPLVHPCAGLGGQQLAEAAARLQQQNQQLALAAARMPVWRPPHWAAGGPYTEAQALSQNGLASHAPPRPPEFQASVLASTPLLSNHVAASPWLAAPTPHFGAASASQPLATAPPQQLQQLHPATLAGQHVSLPYAVPPPPTLQPQGMSCTAPQSLPPQQPPNFAELEEVAHSDFSSDEPAPEEPPGASAYLEGSDHDLSPTEFLELLDAMGGATPPLTPRPRCTPGRRAATESTPAKVAVRKAGSLAKNKTLLDAFRPQWMKRKAGETSPTQAATTSCPTCGRCNTHGRVSEERREANQKDGEAEDDPITPPPGLELNRRGRPRRSTFKTCEFCGISVKQVNAPRLWCSFYLRMKHPSFDLVPMLIGKGGCNTRRIADETNTKVRVRGKGSGHKEFPTGKEAPTPLMVVVATEAENPQGFKQAIRLTLELLQDVENRYKRFCFENNHTDSSQGFVVGPPYEHARAELKELLCEVMPTRRGLATQRKN